MAAPLRRLSAGTVLVVLELGNGRLSLRQREILGTAGKFAHARDMAVLALVFAAVADDAATTEFAEAGADRIIWTVDDAFERHAPEAMAQYTRIHAERLDAAHLVFDDEIPGTGDVARRLAAATGWSCSSAIVQLLDDRVVRRAAGGTADWIGPPGRILLLTDSVGELVEGRRPKAPVEIVYNGPAAALVQHSVPLRPDPETVPLAEADFIVSAGNGVTDWAAFTAVAAALGATRGASRAVVDAGHMPRHRQIGVSGTLVEPSCYIALGIAGASQHLEGIRKCEHVVAVNTDLHADMVKRADLAIIQDAQPVMRVLAALAERRRGHG